MNILTVSYYDDNYGDMLIRICFTSLLKVVLKNLHIQENSCSIFPMSLKVIDEEAVRDSDLIFFAGGALFGLNYENFFRSMEQIIRIAEEEQIPVILSSIGANNRQANSENEEQLSQLLQRYCIRIISVRDNPELFRNYCRDRELPVLQVCDPAVWTGAVYGKELPARVPHEKPMIGINVVRGGLFRDNGYDWGMSDEIRYLEDLRQKLEEAGMDYRFYTNGSLLDNNTLRYFAEEKQVPAEKIILNQTTRELVHTMADFDAVFAIRMHSSIIAYSLGIPAVNLIWHEKIPLFYRAIGREERAIPLEHWNADTLYAELDTLLKSSDSSGPQSESRSPEPDYAMSLYHFLYETLAHFTADGGEIPQEPFSYEEITAFLKEQVIPLAEDVTDLRRKVLGGERKYFGKFKESRRNDARIKELEKALMDAEKALSIKSESLEKVNRKLKETEQKFSDTRQELKKTKEELKKAQSALDHINSHLTMRAYHKVKDLLNK